MSEKAEARRALWSNIYVVTQVVSVVFVLTGAIIVFVASGSQGFKVAHGQVGMAIVILVVLIQPIAGFLMPKTKDGVRLTWRVAHWVVGIIAVVLGWANMYFGLGRYKDMFGGSVTAFVIILSIAIGAFGLFYLVLLARDLVLKKTDEAASTNGMKVDAKASAVEV
eukprot:TRINITY_DN17750_c0_g1_i1.p1 TRINITY_DN17750_c0_g1~~TRINITY_DN17750_c0_g1_i1.p1  ORF type:complete len:185 (-),score=25.76 TRINITY_DN17750_c0_g1_i1:124-621(-)